MPHDVFISYAHRDKAAADAVCATLEAHRIRCWIAPRDILPGMDWGEAIIDGIQGSRVMVLVYSGSANSSPQIKREVERAVAKEVAVIPLRIEDVPPSKSLEYLISTPHWLDAYTPPLEGHLHRLAESLKMLMRQPRRAQPVPQEALGFEPMPPPQQFAPPSPYNAPYDAPQSWPPQQPAAPYYPPPPPSGPPPLRVAPQFRRGNGTALTSFILGFLFCIPYAGLVGLVLGFLGLRRAGRPEVEGRGRGFAITGIVLGCLSTLMWVLASGVMIADWHNDIAARPAAQAFVHAIASEDLAGAEARTDGWTSERVSDLYDEHFEQWGPMQSVEWASSTFDTDTPAETDHCAVRGEFVFANAHVPIRMLMVHRDNVWRVKDVRILDGSEAGVGSEK